MAAREIYVAMYLLAAGVSTASAALAWSRRGAVAARSLAGMLAAGAWWALLGAADVAADTVEGKLLASQVQYLGIVSAPPLFVATALAVLRGGRPAPRALLAAVWAVPLAVLALAATNAAHHLVWREVVLLGTGLGEYRYGPAFWVFMATSYVEIAAATVVVVVAAWRGRIRRRALGVLTAFGVAGWVTNAIYVFKVAPWPGFDWTVVGWTLIGIGLTWSVLGHGLLELVPRARVAWLEATADGVLVLDPDGRLRHANPAARALLDLGGPGGDGAAAALAAEVGAGPPRVVRREGTAGGRWLEVRTDPVPDGWGRVVGRLLTIRDVTARRNAEMEREKTLEALRRALSEVSTLEALLPICAGCKKIRDDQGAWIPVDRYLAERAGATFTHGLCQDCFERLDREA